MLYLPSFTSVAEIPSVDTMTNKYLPAIVTGPLLFYLYNCPRVTETPENHIFCLKKSINPLYGMSVVWYEAWFTLILQLSII